MRTGCQLLCLCLSTFLAVQPVAWSQERQPQSIRILVLAGQDAINNVEKRVVTEPVVEVQDESGVPVVGAEVKFRTPATGPSVTFYGATRTTTVTTDNGRARAMGMTPNTDLGVFEIQVTATYGSLQADAAITQTNALAPEKSTRKGPFGWRLMTAIGAGVAIGVISGVRRSDDATAATPTSVTFGSINVGTPR